MKYRHYNVISCHYWNCKGRLPHPDHPEIVAPSDTQSPALDSSYLHSN